MVEKVKAVADITAWGVIGAAFIQWLPPVAAALAITWHLTQFYLLWKNKKNGSK